MNSNNQMESLSRSVFGLTIFLAAYLLFQIQPLVGMIVTQQFGGVAAVWCVCLLFFQGVLLCGYTLTYLLARLSVRSQAVAFAVAAVLAAVAVSTLSQSSFAPGSGPVSALTSGITSGLTAGAAAANSGAHPIVSLLLVLTGNLGLPCLFLSMVSGLIQLWYSLSRLGNPYPLYSISNIGSMSALILYPTLIEPRFGIHDSLRFFSAGFAVLALLALASAGSAVLTSKPPAKTVLAESGRVNGRQFSWWIFLSAMSSVVLLSYTTYLTIDIAPAPLLWVLPLCVYLLAYILCFGNEKRYNRAFYLYMGPIIWSLEMFLRSLLFVEVLCVLSIVFCFSMTLVGELVLSKPAPARLPAFYLAIALGGVVGAVFVDIIAPFLFGFYAEPYLIVMIMAGLLLYIAIRHDVRFFKSVWLNNALLIVVFYDCLIVTGACLYWKFDNVVASFRNFYSAVSVIKTSDMMILRNGMTVHGEQFLDKAKSLEPTKYYARAAGLGVVEGYLRRLRSPLPLKFGIIGLGAGTMAAYGKPGDDIVFYEIDPKIEPIARRYFTYLQDCSASVRVVEGDARRQLGREAANHFDLLLVDAFNGDAVPVHMLTKEAVELYFKHIAEGGALVFHISNRYLDLAPVIANVALDLKLSAVLVASGTARFVVLTKAPLPVTGDEHVTVRRARTDGRVGLWTDDYSNLVGALLANKELFPSAKPKSESKERPRHAAK